jgi:hypothetical protein
VCARKVKILFENMSKEHGKWGIIGDCNLQKRFQVVPIKIGLSSCRFLSVRILGIQLSAIASKDLILGKIRNTNKKNSALDSNSKVKAITCD